MWTYRPTECTERRPVADRKWQRLNRMQQRPTQVLTAYFTVRLIIWYAVNVLSHLSIPAASRLRRISESSSQLHFDHRSFFFYIIFIANAFLLHFLCIWNVFSDTVLSSHWHKSTRIFFFRHFLIISLMPLVKYRVSIKSFPDYKHLLQENYCMYVEYEPFF